MLGRGLVARPDLALQIRASANGHESEPLGWLPIYNAVRVFHAHSSALLEPIPAAGRLKSWLAHLRHTYPEAEALYQTVRQQKQIASLPVDASP